jgi:exodeoxyribonuclease VII small subunit
LKGQAGGQGQGKAKGEGGASPVLPAESDELTLEARLQRLEEIVGILESGDVELERGLALFEEGVRLIRDSERQISMAELRVEELIGSGSETRALEGADE